MAKLWITEFPMIENVVNGGGIPQAATLPSTGTQVVTFTTSTQSSTLNATTRLVRVISDSNCHIVAAANPTATTSNMYLPSGVSEYFVIRESGLKIAAITA